MFDAFAVFERSVAHVELKRLIFDPPGRAIPQHASVLAACETIRRHLGTLVDSHLGDGAAGFAAAAATAYRAHAGRQTHP